VAILFAAGEIEAFTGTPEWIDGAKYFDAANARCALATDYAFPLSIFPGDIGPTFELKCQCLLEGSQLGGRLLQFFRGGSDGIRLFADNSAQDGVWFQNSSGASEQLLTFDASSTAGRALPEDELFELRVRITLDSSAGAVTVWVNGNKMGSVSGIDTVGNIGGTTYDEVRLRSGYDSSSSEAVWSEMIITDGEDTSQMRLVTLVPASAGALQEWDGSVGSINLTSTGASNLVSASAGEFFTFAHSEAFSSDRLIKAVVLSAAHQLDGTGPSRLRAVQRIGGTNYEIASAGASAAAPFVAVMASSLDGSPWSETKINASQFGWESVA
jgi:hypothetical protein